MTYSSPLFHTSLFCIPIFSTVPYCMYFLFLLLLSAPPLHPKMAEGSNNRFYAHWAMVSPPSSRHPNPLAPLHSTSRCPTSTGAVHKSVTFSCVFRLVQLNKCVVVCGSDLQRGHSGDRFCLRRCCLSMSVSQDQDP